jgi:predicted GNAT family N-acyltransferase
MNNIFALRYRVLREPWQQPLGSERCPNDNSETATHFACFLNESEVVATCRMDRISDTLAQIRFVAVDNTYQGKGYGRTLMLEVERLAEKMGFKRIILHARENAVIFYHNLGYQVVGESYKLWNTIQHYEMAKNISTSSDSPVSLSDKDLYTFLQTAVAEKGFKATQGLVELFLKDIEKRSSAQRVTITKE